MYKIRLSDNTAFDVMYCSARNGVLTMRIISDQSFIQIAELFADADKTSTIYFDYDQTEDTFCGYTVLTVINGTVAGEYFINLKSGV